MFITGATGGIGLALARRLHERGDRVLLHGRRSFAGLPDDVAALGPYCQADLTDPSCHETVAGFLGAHGVEALDVLVLNAATGYYGSVAEQPPDSIVEAIQTNLAAPISLTHALLPRVERAGGRICFLSSIVSSLPSRNLAVYAATKAALEGFARNLRVETRGRVNVQIARPGPTHTGMHEKAGLTREQMDWERFTPAGVAAARLERLLDSGSRARALGVGNQLLWTAGRAFPRLIDGAMRRRVAVRAASASAGDGPRRCFVTGVADGIGRALAHRFARAGYGVAGADIDAEKGERVMAELRDMGVEAEFIHADLRDPGCVERTIASLANGPPMDVIVHNAGVSAAGAFWKIPLEDQNSVLALNLQAPLLLTAGLIREGRVKEDGALIFIASLSCYVGYPGATVYAAAKDGLAAYARALSIALAPGRHVMTVYPGPVRTAHAERYSPDNSRAHRRMAPETLASSIFNGLARKRRVLVPGATNRCVAALAHCWPGPFERMMRRTLFDKLAASAESGGSQEHDSEE